MMTNPRAVAFAFATEVAWQGHATDASIARLAVKASIPAEFAARVVELALTLGMLKPVPRIGGYVAGRKVNARVFGEAFADFMG